MAFFSHFHVCLFLLCSYAGSFDDLLIKFLLFFSNLYSSALYTFYLFPHHFPPHSCLLCALFHSHLQSNFLIAHIERWKKNICIWKSSLPLSGPHSLLSSRAVGWHQTQWHFVEISQRLSPWSVSDLWLPQSSLNSSQFLAGVDTASVVAKLEMGWIHCSSVGVFVLLTRCRIDSTYWCMKFHCH